MDIQTLKEYILENDLISDVLEELGCHHIRHKDGYYQCANPDGDNITAVCVYENTNLTTINYTRDITNGKNSSSDLITLVEFYKQETFPYAVKWLCDILGIDYYYDNSQDIPDSLQITKTILDLQNENNVFDEEKPFKPISEIILNYYKPYANKMFAEDGVSYETQQEFEIGYDEITDRITIPIRDDIGNLVGVKGRYFYREVPENKQKFIYLEKCARSQILYGLYKTINFIKRRKRVFVTEAEKGVLQLYSAGFYECVATGGKKISRCQIDKLTRLCVPIIFAFDKDVGEKELEDIANKFVTGTEIYAIIDTDNILNEKESPMDNIDKFKKLIKNNLYKIK